MSSWLPPQYAAQVQKIGMVLPVSEELLREHTPPTEEQQREWRERAIRGHNAAVNRHAAALNRAQGVARGVLEMHAPVFATDHDSDPTCDGCEFTGWEGEPPYWPCQTYELVEKWETA